MSSSDLYTEDKVLLVIGRRLFRTMVHLDVAMVKPAAESMNDAEFFMLCVTDSRLELLKRLKSMVKLGDELSWTPALKEGFSRMSNSTLEVEGADTAVLVRRQRVWEQPAVVAARTERDGRRGGAERKQLFVLGKEAPESKFLEDFFSTSKKRGPGESRKTERKRLAANEDVSTAEPSPNRWRPAASPDATAFCAWLLGHPGFRSLLLPAQSSSNLNSTSQSSLVLDVAGGKGELSSLLVESGVCPSELVIIDPKENAGGLSRARRKLLRKIGFKESARVVKELFELLNEPCARPCDSEPDDPTYNRRTLSVPQVNALGEKARLILGLHPDEATGDIVDYCVAHRIPFAVVPCCVFSRNFQHRKIFDKTSWRSVYSREDLVRYLAERFRKIQVEKLPDFQGANDIVWCTFDSD